MDKTSMCFWWDRVKDLDIPMPETIIIPFDKSTQTAYDHWDEEHLVQDAMVKCIAESIAAYPVFIRTDQSSAKHSWVDSCFIEDPSRLGRNLYGVLEFNPCRDFIGLTARAFIVREYIPMAEVLKAFHDMPVNPERRYFVNDGKVLCHHAYWIEDAIEKGHRKSPLPANWKEILSEANRETPDEVMLLTKYAAMIANELDGFWSVDFCKAADGTWYFIDMAIGQRSWHPEDCKYATEEATP